MCASPEPAESRVITTEDSIAMADTPAAADVPKMIRIDKLVARHEPAPPGPLGVPVKTLIAQYEKIPTATVSDVLREHGVLDCAFPGTLHALFTDRIVAGIAFTVKSSPNTRITGEMTIRGEMLDALAEDAFVVWDTSGDTHGTMWGGVMTAKVAGKGVKGAIIDGGIRDTAQIIGKRFPVWYRYRSPNGSLGRCQITHYEIPVRVGDVFVRPGDIIVGDIDGTVCVPREIAVDVLARAREILVDEDRIFEWVSQGKSVAEITAAGGYF